MRKLAKLIDRIEVSVGPARVAISSASSGVTLRAISLAGPSPEQSRLIVRIIFTALRYSSLSIHKLQLSENAVDQLALFLPRKIREVVKFAAGQTLLAMRHVIKANDIPLANTKPAIGFR